MNESDLSALRRDVARKCPLATRAFLARKFALPQYRAPDYYPQDLINEISLMMLMLPALPNYQDDDVVRSQLLNLFQALTCDRPTLFLERELGEILLKTEIPGFLETSDIHFPFPSLRVHLPRKLLGLEAQDRWLMYLDIGSLPADTEVGCRKDIAAELDRYGQGGRLFLSRMSFHYPVDVLTISAQLDKGVASSYALTKPLKGTLEEFKAFKGKLSTEFPNDAEDDKLIAGMQKLTLNILLILSTVPLEYEPLIVERKERTEGKRTIPALMRAKWVGDCLLRAKRKGHVKGELPINGHTIPAHFVSGHWKHQPHGKGFALRKLIYILPYKTGKTESEEKAA